MIQLALIGVCGIGCLIALGFVARSLMACIQQAVQGTPFLASVSVSSCDGESAPLPSGLMQVQYLAGHVSTSPQTDGEAQA
jgi:hypothetical protein